MLDTDAYILRFWFPLLLSSLESELFLIDSAHSFPAALFSAAISFSVSVGLYPKAHESIGYLWFCYTFSVTRLGLRVVKPSVSVIERIITNTLRTARQFLLSIFEAQNCETDEITNCVSNDCHFCR